MLSDTKKSDASHGRTPVILRGPTEQICHSTHRYTRFISSHGRLRNRQFLHSIPMTATGILTTGESVRLACRSGNFRSPTSGHCPQYVQANLLVLPLQYPDDFRGLCLRNPVPCPLLGENVGPGDLRLAEGIARDSDVRTDVPGYNMWV